MDLSASVLGKAVCSYLEERQTSPVLTIGRDRFTRAALARVACFHYSAAANLSRILNTEIRVRDTRDVYENVHPDRLVLPRLGAVTLAVLGAAFEAKKIGGEEPLANWFRKHREGAVVTFGALKAHDAHVAASRERKPTPRKGSA